MPEGAGTQEATVTVWLHWLVLPHVSVTVQVPVITRGQGPLLVTELKLIL